MGSNVQGEVPYEVKIDNEGCGIALRKLGVPDKKIENLKIVIARKAEIFSKVTAASYDISNGNIEMYSELFWEKRKKFLEKAKRITDGEIKPNKQFRNLLYTKRLEVYLTKVPPERGMNFAEKLIARAVNREFTGTLFHEIRHATDISNELVLELCLLFHIMTLGLKLTVLSLMYAPSRFLNKIGKAIYVNTDFLEKRADSFKKKGMDNPEWNNLLTITPKFN